MQPARKEKVQELHPGGWRDGSVSPDLSSRGTFELSVGAQAGKESGLPLTFLGEFQAAVLTC